MKQIRVTYHYPAWTGMPTEVEERGGDLRAVTAPRPSSKSRPTGPLQGGQIQLDNGQKVKLTGGENNVYRAPSRWTRTASITLPGVEQGQPVRVSEDFFIEARKANPPKISMVRPRGDYHASPIEEVTVAPKPTDEYGLTRRRRCTIPINGGPETAVDLLQAKGREAGGRFDHALA